MIISSWPEELFSLKGDCKIWVDDYTGGGLMTGVFSQKKINK
jgi:hypothetical protein